jgi:hypothetical protein
VALDAFYGDGRAPGAPALIDMALFVGDPTSAGTELTSTGGYARVQLGNNSTIFPDALPSNSYAKLVGIPLRFPVSTAAWSGTPDHWAFFDHATGDLLDSGTITGSATISAANQILRFDTNTIEITVA